MTVRVRRSLPGRATGARAEPKTPPARRRRAASALPRTLPSTVTTGGIERPPWRRGRKHAVQVRHRRRRAHRRRDRAHRHGRAEVPV